MRKFLALFRISVVGAFQYRGNAVVGLLFYAMFISVFFFLWRTIYANGAVNGYSLVQMVWYMCVSELIIFAGRAPVFGTVSEDVKNGSIAYPLCRPVHYMAMQAATGLGGTAFSFTVTAVVGLVLGFLYVGPIPGFQPLLLPLMLVSVVLGMGLQMLSNMALALTAFYFEENAAFSFLYSKLVFMLGAFIPVEFLPVWLQKIVVCLPFSFVAWAPCRNVVAFEWGFYWWAVGWQVFWCVVTGICAWGLYRGGVRRLQGQGG